MCVRVCVVIKFSKNKQKKKRQILCACAYMIISIILTLWNVSRKSVCAGENGSSPGCPPPETILVSSWPACYYGDKETNHKL